jgi:hypothetical protein
MSFWWPLGITGPLIGCRVYQVCPCLLYSTCSYFPVFIRILQCYSIMQLPSIAPGSKARSSQSIRHFNIAIMPPGLVFCLPRTILSPRGIHQGAY